MGGDILSIGKSGLFAAQAGLSTTGHNITNANVAGYTRQVVVQSTSAMMQYGYGFLGTGTQIAQVKRITDEFLNAQVRTAQASTSALTAYYSQISQIDNMLADTTSGLSPALQDFFQGVQGVTIDHGSVPSRQSLLSSAQTLAARFQAMDSRLKEIRTGVNGQITASVTAINAYAQQIAQLNDQIGTFGASDLRLPNDLLDQRDQLVLELNKYVKATVVPGDNNSVTVSIGSGQPLVVGKQAFQLAATASPTDLMRVEVGYVIGDKVSLLPAGSLSGGELGGLLDFRANTLDRAQNALGRIAIGLAMTFNAQHQLGLDANGQPGGAFFTVPPAQVTQNVKNNPTSTTAVQAVVADPTQLTDSDYKVEYDGANYIVTRLSDNKKTTISPYSATGTTQRIDGIDFTLSGNAAAGDNFMVRPTINGASGFQLALTDVSQIAAAAPVATSVPGTNKGNASISAGKVDAAFLATPPALPVTLQYDDAGKQLTGFPPGLPVTVVDSSGNTTTYPAPPTGVAFQAGATYTFGGVSVTLSGVPQDQDTFTISANAGGVGDVRNMGLLGDLQTTNIFNGGKATYQSAYAQLTSLVGNKTREVQVGAQAADTLLSRVTAASLNVSGVNLDEEATNLLKYQQAYQAAGKVMQIAGTVFDTLLSIGR